MKAEEFRQRWGLTNAAIAKLIDSNPSTVMHWASVGEHDAKRKEPPPVERLFDILNSIFLLLESNPAIEEAWLSRGGRGDRRRKGVKIEGDRTELDRP